ncbi:hypothetical protein ACOMHN_018030 [Nucella lapillus]
MHGHRNGQGRTTFSDSVHIDWISPSVLSYISTETQSAQSSNQIQRSLSVHSDFGKCFLPSVHSDLLDSVHSDWISPSVLSDHCDNSNCSNQIQRSQRFWRVFSSQRSQRLTRQRSQRLTRQRSQCDSWTGRIRPTP